MAANLTVFKTSNKDSILLPFAFNRDADQRFIAPVCFSNVTISQITAAAGSNENLPIGARITMNVCQRNWARFSHCAVHV